MPSDHFGKRVSVRVRQMHVALPVMVGFGVFSNILFIFLCHFCILHHFISVQSIFGFDVLPKKGVDVC